jgi:hypothetical protein
MHTPWGLGASLLATPFHILGRFFGAPGFPDDVRFLILYALTTVVLARALHDTSSSEPTAVVVSAAAATFVMAFPTFVGLIASRFLIYEHTIATGALWSVLLLSGVLALLHRSSSGRLVAVCAAAGLSTMIRPPLAVYGLTTVIIAMIIARRKGMRHPALLPGLFAYAAVTALYFAGNVLRFGSPVHAGFENGTSGFLVNRLARWGLPFAKVRFAVAAQEMFATLFPQIMRGTPPPWVRPHAVGLRWREYYAPTYDLLIFIGWLAALMIVCSRVVRRRLWRPDRDLAGEVATVVGAWALPPSIVLFVFYARIGNMVTRYASDMYPAFAAALLCVGMAIVDAVRKHAPRATAPTQLAIAGGVAVYMTGWHGWPTHLSRPIDRDAVLARIAEIDARSADMPPVPDHFRCNESRGPPPVAGHLIGWQADCSFVSGMVFAMPYSPCVSFALGSTTGTWDAAADESLAGFRANGDFDPLLSCGAPRLDGNVRLITMCEPHRPAFLLDGLRLYSIASLDANLDAIDRLTLQRIDTAPACP